MKLFKSRDEALATFAFIVVTFFSLVVTQFTTQWLTGDEEYYRNHPWLAGIGLLVSCTIMYFLIKHFGKVKGKKLINLKTGEEIIISPIRLFYGVDLFYWLIGLVVVLFLVGQSR